VADWKGRPLVFNIRDRDTFSGVLSNIANEYFDLANSRNNLLHATWFVGFVSSEDQRTSTFTARKFSLVKQGISRVPLATNAKELQQLPARRDHGRNC